ncbi:hypothetical protein BofuT4_P112430.1 [Botrytis cinerea T4]|uniref:Uncharacterized protein n=1 Tax=Botryotinia fuckeliana (strain T4) TaxID=999810 RepID=G2Y5J3_BOTF4|nr:hypothetical protein BofuT4_P112430.1 [Botrytis cinerea T4]
MGIDREQQAHHGSDDRDSASQATMVIFLFISMLSLSDAMHEPKRDDLHHNKIMSGRCGIHTSNLHLRTKESHMHEHEHEHEVARWLDRVNQWRASIDCCLIQPKADIL